MTYTAQGSLLLLLCSLLTACPASQAPGSAAGAKPNVDTVCGEALAEYQACGWDEASPGRPRLHETVDSIYSESCPEAVHCEAQCFLDTSPADPCWECEFTDADCFGSGEVFNPLMDCLKACPNW